MSFFDKFNEISVYYNLMYFRYHMIWTCSLSFFCVRNLYFCKQKHKFLFMAKRQKTQEAVHILCSLAYIKLYIPEFL